MNSILITREKLLSRRLSVSPNAMALPDDVLTIVQTTMTAFNRTSEKDASFEIIIVDDDPREHLVGCFVYEDDLKPGVFVATVSAALASLLYLFRVSVRETAGPPGAMHDAERFNVPHPSTRCYQEILAFLCRDNREPTPLLRRILTPDKNVLSRWPALEELAGVIRRRQTDKSDKSADDQSDAKWICAAIRFIAEHEYAHVARRHSEVHQLACTGEPQLLSVASFTWSAECEADQLAQALIQSSVEDWIPVADLPAVLFEHPGEREMFYWWNLFEGTFYVMSLMFVQEKLVREKTRLEHLNGPRDAFVQQQRKLLSEDNYPPVAFRYTLAHRRLWERVAPDATEAITRMARHYLRYMVDRTAIAFAEWLEDPTFAALGAVAFDDGDSFEVEERFLKHCQMEFYEVMDDLPPLDDALSPPEDNEGD